MGQRIALLAGALMLLVSITVTARATVQDDRKSAVADELMEAFIGLRLGQGGSSFYRILVDYDETPYIALESFLSDWLGLKPECDTQREFCNVTLPGESVPRWIDGQNGLMSDARTGQDINLQPEHLILKNDTLWVHYEALEQWLPLRAVWSLNAYQMSVNTFFALPKERLREREQKRLREREQKEQRSQKSPNDLVRVPDKGNQFYEARAEIQGSVDSNGESSARLSFDVGADVYQGRLQAGGSASQEQLETIEYWQYERFNNPTGDYLAFGQVFYEGNLIHRSNVLTDGYRFMRHYQAEGSGEFTLNATVPEEAIVDIYKNGFYEKTVIADKLGQVVLTDIQVGSGDVITLRSITKEGAESEQRYKIAGAANQYLDAGDWDYEFVGGSNQDGSVHSLDLSYGLAPHLTAGITLQKDSSSGQSNTSTIASLSFRPHHRVSMQWQQDVAKGDWAYSTDVSLWVTSDLRFFGQNIESNSTSGLVNSLPDSFHGIEHQWGNPRLQVQSRLIHSDLERRFRERIGVKLQNRWDMRIEAERTWYKDLNRVRDSWEMRHIYALSGGSKFEAGIGGNETSAQWFTGLRWLGESQAPWSQKVTRNRYSFDASVRGSQGHIEPSLGLTWYHEDALSGSMRASKEAWQADVRWKFGVARKTGRYNNQWHRQSFDHFRLGTIQGRLMSPSTGDKASQPLANTRLWVSNYAVRTDEEGYFRVDGLPVNQSLPFHVDMETLSIDMMPATKQWNINVRPGTVLDFDPPMIWSVGVDGFVAKELYKPGMELVFKHETLGMLAEVPVEIDGFFIAERLAPGDYTVTLMYQDSDSKTIQLTVDANQTWISDVHLHPSQSMDR